VYERVKIRRKVYVLRVLACKLVLSSHGIYHVSLCKITAVSRTGRKCVQTLADVKRRGTYRKQVAWTVQVS
jgi:hypothetical protein